MRFLELRTSRPCVDCGKIGTVHSAWRAWLRTKRQREAFKFMDMVVGVVLGIWKGLEPRVCCLQARVGVPKPHCTVQDMYVALASHVSTLENYSQHVSTKRFQLSSLKFSAIQLVAEQTDVEFCLLNITVLV